MSSENYRFYRLDGAGHLYDAEWFDADSDEAAIARIATEHPEAKCEIWRGKRLVAALLPKRRQA